MTFQCKEHLLMANSHNHLTKRVGTSVVHTPAITVLFGGQIISLERKSNEVWWIARNRLDWHLQLTFGDVPVPTSDHTAVYDNTSNR